MRYAVVYMPTTTVMATRATEVAAMSRRSYIGDRLGFDKVKVIAVEDSVKKGDMLGLAAYR